MAGAVSFGKSGLCFSIGFPVVLVVVMAAVQVVTVVAVTPALGVWEDERLRTSIRGKTGCLLLWMVELYLQLKSTYEKNKQTNKQKLDETQADLQGLQASEF